MAARERLDRQMSFLVALQIVIALEDLWALIAPKGSIAICAGRIRDWEDIGVVLSW